ncbi:MAG: tyrosine-type recombinase/integrase [Aminipila sp.]
MSLDGTTRFEDYAAKWLETAELAPATRTRYEALLVRINAAIGHIKLEKLQGHHLEEFYQNLREAGVKEKGRWAVSTGLDALMTERKLTRDRVSKLAGIAPSTVGVARKGDRISIEKAQQIADALELSIEEIFQVCESTSGLSDKTILHHHRLISAILSKAKRERIIPFNVATEHATAPKIRKKEANHLNDEQAQQFVQLLFSEEDIRIKTALLVSIFSGVRRGELCGLSWGDIDYKNSQIHIRRASQYQPGKGVVEVPTKNDSSQRSIGLPNEVFNILREYRKWWTEQRFKNGSKWQGKQSRLFIQENGSPINPDTINFWLNQFTEKNGLQHTNPHALRHTFATLQIASGVDVRTLQARTGHAQASTLLNTYSHALKSAEEAATKVLEDTLIPSQWKGKIG